MKSSNDAQQSEPQNEVLRVLVDWNKEAFDPRNDGWVQNHYREKLISVKEYVSSIENLSTHK
tara:strand:+ start:50513 stop:50698 length:186 start_codon:yes stop_codon:yes gene_type:complete